jgi:hypothetical protein
LFSGCVGFSSFLFFADEFAGVDIDLHASASKGICLLICRIYGNNLDAGTLKG